MGLSSASRKQGTVVHDFNSSILERKENPQLQNEFKDTLGCMKQHLGEKSKYLSFLLSGGMVTSVQINRSLSRDLAELNRTPGYWK